MVKPMTITSTCPFCGSVHAITVDEFDYTAWEFGVLTAQEAFPYLTADEREMLISGICPQCWAETFGE